MLSLKDKIAARLAANKQESLVSQSVTQSVTQANTQQQEKQVKITLPTKLTPKLVNTNQSQSDSHSQPQEIATDGIVINKNSDIGHILNNIESLKLAIHEVHPTMPQLLQTIWKQLKDNPDCVTILKPEQIAVIVQGAEIQTNIKISEGISKPRASKKKVLTVDDV